MEGFAERLRAAMLAAGVESAADLAARCELPTALVMDWIATNGDSISGRHVMALRHVLGVRPLWLMEEEGPVGVTSGPLERRALATLEAIPGDRIEAWLDMGRWLSIAKDCDLPW